MKGFAVLLLVACVTAVRAKYVISGENVNSVDYANMCPPEQEENWQIEQLLRHEDCNKFYKCTFGYPVEYSCYPGLYFNLETWQCDWMHNVDCADRNIPEEDLPSTTLAPVPPTTTTTEPTTTTTEPTTTTTEPTTTTTEPTTTTTTPEPTTTTTTTEPTTTTTTPEPTTTTTTTTTTTPAPTTTTTTTEPTTTTTTPEPTTTTTTPEPTTTTTTTTTTTPAPTTSTTTTTPAPTTTTTTTTPAPTTTTTTTTEPPTTTTTSTTTSTTTTPAPEPETEGEDIEFQENGCPVNPHIHWLLPHEVDCNLFYYCVWGQKVLRQCPASLHFNTVLQVCDWPFAAGCTLSVNKNFQFSDLLRHLL